MAGMVGEWELAFTGHARRQLEERGIIEVDLRAMLGRPWTVIVEPDPEEDRLVIVTAYEL